MTLVSGTLHHSNPSLCLQHRERGAGPLPLPWALTWLCSSSAFISPNWRQFPSRVTSHTGCKFEKQDRFQASIIFVARVNERIRESQDGLGWEGIEIPSTIPGCSKAHPKWLWTIPEPNNSCKYWKGSGFSDLCLCEVSAQTSSEIWVYEAQILVLVVKWKLFWGARDETAPKQLWWAPSVG